MNDELSMSMFANRADYDAAVAAREADDNAFIRVWMAATDNYCISRAAARFIWDSSRKATEPTP